MSLEQPRSRTLDSHITTALEQCHGAVRAIEELETKTRGPRGEVNTKARKFAADALSRHIARLVFACQRLSGPTVEPNGKGRVRG